MGKDLKDTFDGIVLDYEEARPGYPADLIRDIVKISSINEGGQILEVGCGTGQATEHFLNLGYSVTGIELGNKLTDFLKVKFKDYSNFKVYNSAFEEWQDEASSYDLIISATAFHWIKPEIGYPKAHGLLRDTGTIALFWHMSPIIKHSDSIFQNIRKIYSLYAPELDHSKTEEELEEIHKKRQDDILKDNLFRKLDYRTYRWEEEYSIEKFIKLLNTFSSYQMLDNNKREFVLGKIQDNISKNGGKIVVPQEVRLYCAEKNTL